MKTLTTAVASAMTIMLATAAPKAATDQGHTTEVTTAKGPVYVTPYTNDIFRVSTTRELPVSQSAILAPTAPRIRTSVSAGEFVMSSPTTTLRIDKRTGRVRFYDASGRLLLSELNGVDNRGDVKTVTFEGGRDETFYGAGERGHSLRLNGDSLVMFNRQNYCYTSGDPRISQMGITMPWFVSDAGYGVLVDDYNMASLALRDTITYTSDTPKPLSYYFINGDGTLAGATSRYTQLTGRQDLPPFWSLGYITSKYGYHNQAETLGAIDSLKNRDYPVDGIVLDLYWYGVESDMGRLAWDPEQWPDHRKMMDDLQRQGVNIVLISQPYVNKKGAIDNYNMLSSKGMLAKDADGNTHDVTTWVGDAGMIDVSNPETREWLWERLKGLTAEGVDGWWGDLGEPEVHPLTIVHNNGETASQYHNVYGNEWSRLIYEGLRRDYPDMRPLLMMRGGTAGLQRYSVMPWTTDVSRSWGGLQPQVNLMLNSGLSGLGYMSSDIGGFAVDPAHPTDPELYVRWLQMGTFTPVLRTHAQTKPEPYHYPQQEEITRRFIKMRYEWLPYNYTLAYENASQGLPLARPLNFRGDNPDSRYSGITDEYLWGDNVLIAPVMTAGARQRKVIFPEGEWISWNHPSLTYRGGTTSTVKAPLNELPMFVRAGSFIPQYMQPIENVTQYDPQYLTIRYFPSDTWTSYTLFDDNRLSPTSLADRAYQLTTFSGRRHGNNIEISMKSDGGRYEGMPAYRVFTFEIEGVDKKPVSVTASDGTALPAVAKTSGTKQGGWWYDAANHTLGVRLPWAYEDNALTIVL